MNTWTDEWKIDENFTASKQIEQYETSWSDLDQI